MADWLSREWYAKWMPVLLVFGLIAALSFGSYVFAEESCYRKTESFESRFGAFIGCQIHYKDRWINWENYRGSGE